MVAPSVLEGEFFPGGEGWEFVFPVVLQCGVVGLDFFQGLVGAGDVECLIDVPDGGCGVGLQVGEGDFVEVFLRDER